MTLGCERCGSTYRDPARFYPCVELIRDYTDGRAYTDPQTHRRLIFYCGHCQSISTLEQARIAGEERKRPVLLRPFLRNAPLPPPTRYLEAIERGLAASPEEEVELRLEAWRRSNDSYRDLPDRRKPPPHEQPTWWRENIRRLQELLPDDRDGNGVWRAELSREQGEFAECLEQIAALKRNQQATDVKFLTVDISLIDAIEILAFNGNAFVQAFR